MEALALDDDTHRAWARFLELLSFKTGLNQPVRVSVSANRNVILRDVRVGDQSMIATRELATTLYQFALENEDRIFPFTNRFLAITDLSGGQDGPFDFVMISLFPDLIQ